MEEPVWLLLVEYPRHDPRTIIENLIKSIKNIKIEGRMIIAMPENWITNKPIGEEYYASLLEEAYKETGYDILGGLSYVIDDGEAVSRGLAIIDGKIRKTCEKIFPSRAVGERGRIRPGRFIGPLEVSGLRIGCIACVDIFYPEIARRLVLEGSTVLYNPALIPYDRVQLWHSVLASRAAENTVYTVGVNAAGVPYPDGRYTGGGSIVFTPRGERLRGTLLSGSLLFRIDNQLLGLARSRWAFHEDLTRGHVRDRLGYGIVS